MGKHGGHETNMTFIATSSFWSQTLVVEIDQGDYSIDQREKICEPESVVDLLGLALEHRAHPIDL
jgi:hypothetical protein